jgi:hypothetical protein
MKCKILGTKSQATLILILQRKIDDLPQPVVLPAGLKAQ